MCLWPVTCTCTLHAYQLLQAQAQHHALLCRTWRTRCTCSAFPAQTPLDGSITASRHMPITYPSSASWSRLTPSPSNLTELTSFSEQEYACPALARPRETAVDLCDRLQHQGLGPCSVVMQHCMAEADVHRGVPGVLIVPRYKLKLLWMYLGRSTPA